MKSSENQAHAEQGCSVRLVLSNQKKHWLNLIARLGVWVCMGSAIPVLALLQQRMKDGQWIPIGLGIIVFLFCARKFATTCPAQDCDDAQRNSVLSGQSDATIKFDYKLLSLYVIAYIVSLLMVVSIWAVCISQLKAAENMARASTYSSGPTMYESRNAAEVAHAQK